MLLLVLQAHIYIYISFYDLNFPVLKENSLYKTYFFNVFGKLPAFSPSKHVSVSLHCAVESSLLPQFALVWTFLMICM